MTQPASPPSNDEIDAETDAVRRSLLAGIQRMLLGQPQRVPVAALSISNLATEANVARHHLYQGHRDLRERFEFLRERAGEPTAAENELRRALETALADTARLRQLQHRTHEQAEHWKALSQVFQRAINVLQEELRQEQVRSERLARRLQASTGEASGAIVLLRTPEQAQLPRTETKANGRGKAHPDARTG